MVNYRDPQADPLYGVDDAEVSQNWWGQAPAGPARQRAGRGRLRRLLQQRVLPAGRLGAVLVAVRGHRAGPGADIPGVLNGDFQAYDPALGGTPAGVEILAHSRVTDHRAPGS